MKTLHQCTCLLEPLSLIYHIHNERADYSAPTCTVEMSANLASNDWSAVGLEFVGESAVINNFKTITNRTDIGNGEFLRLKVEQE